MSKKLVYVAGPYRDPRGSAFVERNIRTAEHVAQQLWGMGFAVICPHANTRHFEGIIPCEEFIRGDLAIVERCDAIVMIPGSEDSQGAMQEMHHAQQNDVPVYWWPLDKANLAASSEEWDEDWGEDVVLTTTDEVPDTLPMPAG